MSGKANVLVGFILVIFGLIGLAVAASSLNNAQQKTNSVDQEVKFACTNFKHALVSTSGLIKNDHTYKASLIEYNTKCGALTGQLK